MPSSYALASTVRGSLSRRKCKFARLRSLSMALCSLAAQAPAPRHVTVYYEPGRYGGWPANHGIWRWGNEIVVGFSEGRYAPDQPGHIAGKETVYDRQARSRDGGEHWQVEPRRIYNPPQQISNRTAFTHLDTT